MKSARFPTIPNFIYSHSPLFFKVYNNRKSQYNILHYSTLTSFFQYFFIKLLFLFDENFNVLTVLDKIFYIPLCVCSTNDDTINLETILTDKPPKVTVWSLSAVFPFASILVNVFRFLPPQIFTISDFHYNFIIVFCYNAHIAPRLFVKSSKLFSREENGKIFGVVYYEGRI